MWYKVKGKRLQEKEDKKKAITRKGSYNIYELSLLSNSIK